MKKNETDTISDHTRLELITDELHDALFRGQRVLYPDCIIQEDTSGNKACVLFQVKQRVPNGPLRNLKSHYAKVHDINIMNLSVDDFASVVCDDIQQYSLQTQPTSLKSRFARWGSCEFENWLDIAIETHYIECEWLKSTRSVTDDYAFLLTVKSIIQNDLDLFKQEYGNAMVLTQLQHF